MDQQPNDSGPTESVDTQPADDAKNDLIFGQADVDRIVSDRLRRVHDKYADYDEIKQELEQRRDSERTDQEKAVAEAVKAAKAEALAQVQPEMEKLQIAIAKGLPEELAKRVLSAAKRLVGSNRDELEQDATEFFAASPIQVGSSVSFGQGVRTSSTPTSSLASGQDLWAERHAKK